MSVCPEGGDGLTRMGEPPAQFAASARLLTREQVELLHTSSLRILEEIGVAVHEQDASTLLEDAGAEVDHKTSVVKVLENLVLESLKKTPKSVRFYSRDHKNDALLEGDNAYYSPGSTTPFIRDRSGVIRRPISADLVDLVRLVDVLENIQLQSTALVVSDIPDSVADLYRLFLVVKNSAKPVMTGAFNIEGLQTWRRYLRSSQAAERSSSKSQPPYSVRAPRRR
jgi:trimethylamine--corrinoid protein Co-methyltransferase